MDQPKILLGKVALVTGASRGIGKEIAIKLGSLGAKVIVNYSSSEDKANEVVKKIESIGGSAYKLKFDVSNENEVINAVNEIIENNISIDILINNAGITRDGLLMRMKSSQWDEVIDTNLKGVYLCTKYVSKFMLKKRSGHIINITSIVGIIGNPGQANYSAAKAGVIGLTQSAAKEFASRGITVNAVAPGFISTDMTKDLNGEAILAAIPLGRFGNPEDVAGAVRFLAADPSALYITGQTIQVDGGMVMS